VAASESQRTDAEGVAELPTPPGVVTLAASAPKADGGNGRATVTVPEGQTVAAEIVLKPPEKAAP
jgi:hypothetical protein